MKLDNKKVEDREMEMLLNEIPHLHHHDLGGANGGDEGSHGNVLECHFVNDNGIALIDELVGMHLADRHDMSARWNWETSTFDDDFSMHKSYVLPDSLFCDANDVLYESEFQQHCDGYCELDSKMTKSGYNMEEAFGKGNDTKGDSLLNFPFSNNFPVDPLWSVKADLSNLHFDSFSNEYSAISLDSWNVQFLLPRNHKCFKEFGGEDSSIKFDDIKVRRKAKHNGQSHLKGEKIVDLENCCGATSPKIQKSPVWSLKYEDLMDVRGYLYYIAKDQHGCRFLQQKLDEGKHWVELIFSGIISHIAEMMVNPFGNYLMQKLLNVCNEEQTMSIVLVLTEEPLVLVKISRNIHGTRAVQKLIETLRTKQEIQLVMTALQPGFLDLINDLNGNHVVQRCLQSFKVEDNKPIFDVAAIHCADIGTQRHGCCVLQRCIAHSTGEQRDKLVSAVSSNGCGLAQDAFGNYLVQYVLGLKIPTANASLAHQFEGKYIHLSMQKFSSNVVERCLKVFSEADKTTIVFELLAMPHFEQLLQHPYANYVIYSALQNSKGSLHAAIMNAIRPHIELVKTSPYCKRIFSRAWLKKQCN